MFLELIAKATQQLDNKLPFVLYRKPKEEVVHGIFQNDAELYHIKDFTETGFVFAPFNSDDAIPFLKIDEKYSVNHKVFVNDTTKAHFASEIDASQKEFHVNLVKKGISNIQNKSFKKVVLSRRVDVPCSTDSLELFTTLLNTYETALCYVWFHPKTGIWLGATPEILLKLENKHLTTMSLAGTQKYIENQEPIWRAKELEEQALVTEYISNAISDDVSGLKILERTSIKAGNLWHLRTKITGRLEIARRTQVIKKIHPTPAVCGMPMASAKNFILENENYNREYYTGYLGELNFKIEKDRTSTKRNQENKAYKSIKTNSTFFVNLRCMKLTKNKAQLYVGGGITKDSNPEKEWQETVAKSNTMLRVLAFSK